MPQVAVVQKLVRAIYTTEPIGMRVSYITEVSPA